MTRTVDVDSELGRVFYAVRDMFQTMINAPTLDSTKRSAGASSLGDLEVANALLETLEKCVSLNPSYRVAKPTDLFRASERIGEVYAQMKHWQALLNSLYGDKEKT